MMQFEGIAAPTGKLSLSLNRQGERAASIPFIQILKRGLPHVRLPEVVNQWRVRNLPHLLKGAHRVWLAEKLGLAHVYGALYLEVIRPMDVSDMRLQDLLGEFTLAYQPGLVFNDWATAKYGIGFKRLRVGLASTRVITTAGVNFITDAFQNSVEVENLKFHGIGTGFTAEAVGDTALVTELTTEYNPDSTRATGTTTEGGGPNIYRTVGTNTLDGTPGAALREHGVFSQAATGGGTLLDRTVYAAITLSSGDGIQSTFDCTFASGS